VEYQKWPSAGKTIVAVNPDEAGTCLLDELICLGGDQPIDYQKSRATGTDHFAVLGKLLLCKQLVGKKNGQSKCWIPSQDH